MGSTTKLACVCDKSNDIASHKQMKTWPCIAIQDTAYTFACQNSFTIILLISLIMREDRFTTLHHHSSSAIRY